MLCPLVHHSLMRSTRRRLCVVGVPCRLSSTLGDIRAFLSALRDRQQLPNDGSIIQLSITEDMRVVVERRPALPDAPPQERSLQGTAATTLEEALRSLQPSAAEQAISPSPSSPSLPVVAHRPLPSPPPQPPRRSGATVLDLTRVASDEVRTVVRHVETSYPSLELVVQHTSGKDLQGTKLHTFHVRLVPRGGRTGTATVVAPELQRLVDTFVGEGVGEGYTGSLRRALKEAFAAAQLPYPTFTAESAQSATLLSLYTQTWQKEGYQLSLRSALPLKDYVECSVRGPFGRPPLDTTTLPLTAAGLRGVLAFVDRVAAVHSPERHAALTRRIRAEPLHLVLPSSRLKVKALLRRLLFFHFGCLDSDVSFTSHPQGDGTHVAEIAVGLPPPQQQHGCDVAADVPRFVVARATGTAARATMQIAAVHAMQTLFPDIFEHQIAYHPEIREIQQSERASACANVPPHVARGLDVVLRWALQLSGADFAVESILLKPSTSYPHWGVATGTSTAWLSQLFVLRPPGSAEPAAATTRELCGFAFDSRKSRSEQKVVAAALAKHFAELCRSAVDCARERNLIDHDGVAVPFGGVQSLSDSDTERYGEALFSDPCLAALAPSRCSTPQPLPDATPRVSALSTFWDAVAVGEGVEPLSVRVQRADAATGYTAQCVTTLPGGEEVHRVVSEASATTEIGALLAVLDAAQRSLGAAAESPLEGSSTAKAQRGSADFLVGIPSSLPTTTPLQTCIDAVGRLYGLRCAVRILQEGMQYTAELSGNFPVDSPLLRRHGRIASSPFFLDRCFVLGRGYAESPLIAVVRAAQQVFEGHVRVHQRTFQDTILAKGLLHLQPAAESRLAQLLETVLTEIAAVSENAVTESGLTLSFRHGEVWELAFSVSTAKQSIKLEETVCQRFLNCARELGQRMSAEMGAEFLPASTLSAVVANSAEGLLQQLCRLAYGLDVRVETKLVHKRWHCRLSLPLTGELSCCIAVASANRKKEAVDAAALAVLSSYFAPETPHIPAYGAVASPRSGTDGEGDAVQTDMESYVFEASSAEKDVTPAS